MELRLGVIMSLRWPKTDLCPQIWYLLNEWLLISLLIWLTHPTLVCSAAISASISSVIFLKDCVHYYFEWLLLKCITVSITFNEAETNNYCGTVPILCIQMMNSYGLQIFLITTIDSSVLPLAHKSLWSTSPRRLLV